MESLNLIFKEVKYLDKVSNINGINLGELSNGSKHQLVFTVENKGLESLYITGIKAGCSSCTTIRTVLPDRLVVGNSTKVGKILHVGEVFDIVADFSPVNFNKGKVVKNITVSYNMLTLVENADKFTDKTIIDTKSKSLILQFNAEIV